MPTNISNPDGFSQDSTSLDKFAPEPQGFDVAESDRTPHTTQRRQINREQAQQQLVALGYKPNDKIFLRAFYHPTDPRFKGDKGRKETATSLDQLIAHATRFQNEGRGVYFVVNGGGQSDDDVLEGRAIFYEHDNLPKAAQIELWKEKGLPEPTFQIDTGGKSIHTYHVFETPIPIEKWVELQKDLLDFTDGDKKIKNASRVMRLAGAYHNTSGNQSLIINNSGKRYTFEELREVIPKPEKPEPKKPETKKSKTKQAENTSNKPNSYKEIEVPVSAPVPLECALGPNSKELLGGVSIERNSSMAALARDLLGVEAEFQSLGQTSSDDAYTLFVDACRNCSPGGGWDEKEWNQIWEYAQTQNPTASNSMASPDAVENCIKGWYWQLQQSFDKESTGDNSPAKKPPSPQATASRIAEQYRHQWKFDNEQKAWRIWTGKEWKRIEIGNFETLLMTVIDAKNIFYGRDAYLTDVLRLLTKKLRVAEWQTWDRKRYISFSNYVLDANKGKSLEHSPGMGFTSHLPFEYKPLKSKVTDALKALQENCPNIFRWMNTAMQGDRRKIFKLLAIINGLLRFRFFDLQMFVHLVGKPGSGKGTFIRLLQKIVGRENWRACKLKQLDDGSTMASIIDKQLVTCPDERNALGVDAILSLTGGDAISYREVYRPSADASFYGLLIVGSNNPIFVGDTTGLDRRLCLIHFDNPLPTARRDSKIEGEMDTEISQLIALALDIPDSEVTKNIQGIGKNQIAEFKLQEWDMKLQTNSVAAHFDDCLIVDPTASTTTGKLYEHYKNWCDSNLKPVSHIKYPKMLSELCNDYLELGSVKWKRSGGRSWFEGLRLRSEGEVLPTHSDSLSALIPTDTGFDTGFDGVCTGFVRGLETLPDGNYSDLRDLEGKNILEKFSLDTEPQGKALKKVEEVGEKLEKVSLNPVNSVEAPKPLLLADLNPVANPVRTPSEPRQTPSEILPIAPPEPPPEPDPAELEIGDRVEITQEGDIYQGCKGKITATAISGGGKDYYVQLEGFDYECKNIVTIPWGADDAAAYLRKL